MFVRLEKETKTMTLKQLAEQYGKGWEFRVFDMNEKHLCTVTTDEILLVPDNANTRREVEKTIESKIYIHLLYIYVK